jgi:hypothetical protein
MNDNRDTFTKLSTVGFRLNPPREKEPDYKPVKNSVLNFFDRNDVIEQQKGFKISIREYFYQYYRDN